MILSLVISFSEAIPLVRVFLMHYLPPSYSLLLLMLIRLFSLLELTNFFSF